MSSFSEHNDAANHLAASHRGLHRHLIPTWLKTPKTLSENIENSAYGETPSDVVDFVLDQVGLKPGELFVDLGCGGGRVLHAVLLRGGRVLGVERNPELFQAASIALTTWSEKVVDLVCRDFLDTECRWHHADIVYATTARFTQSVQLRLAERLQDPACRTRAVACLGRPLPLKVAWSQMEPSLWEIRWNPGESPLEESLYLYQRVERPLPS